MKKLHCLTRTLADSKFLGAAGFAATTRGLVGELAKYNGLIVRPKSTSTPGVFCIGVDGGKTELNMPARNLKAQVTTRTLHYNL